MFSGLCGAGIARAASRSAAWSAGRSDVGNAEADAKADTDSAESGGPALP